MFLKFRYIHKKIAGLESLLKKFLGLLILLIYIKGDTSIDVLKTNSSTYVFMWVLRNFRDKFCLSHLGTTASQRPKDFTKSAANSHCYECW